MTQEVNFGRLVRMLLVRLIHTVHAGYFLISTLLPRPVMIEGSASVTLVPQCSGPSSENDQGGMNFAFYCSCLRRGEHPARAGRLLLVYD